MRNLYRPRRGRFPPLAHSLETMSTLPKILVILGPTAIGKSNLAVELALGFNAEIISADSRQVYTGLDIGTGKITKEEMRGVPHHLLDVAAPNEQYTVADWKMNAMKLAQEIIQRGCLPIVCGGTGLYIQSVVDNVSFPEVKPDKALRQKLEEKTNEELCAILNSLDSERLKTIDKDNPRRLIRAIEIATEMGHVPTIKTKPLFNTLQIGLTLPREELRERIRARLYQRLENGLIEEVEKLHKKGLSFERMIELGLEYRYIALHLKKELTLSDMKAKLETEICKYAKRQETWFKRDERIEWFSPSQNQEIEKAVGEFLEKGQE